MKYVCSALNIGKREESNPTDVSANTSVDVLVNTPPTHYQCIGQHVGGNQ